MATQTETEDRVTRLVEALRAKTATGEITWQPTDMPGAFAYGGGGGSVILESEDHDGQAPFVLRLLDPSGFEVESFTTWAEESDPGELPFAGAVADLYRLIRAALHTSDQVLDNLLAELQSA